MAVLLTLVAVVFAVMVACEIGPRIRTRRHATHLGFPTRSHVRHLAGPYDQDKEGTCLRTPHGARRPSSATTTEPW